MTSGVTSTVIPKKYVKVQSEQPTNAVQGDLWVDSDNNVLYQYTGSTWAEVTQDLTYLTMQQQIQALSILYLEANATLTPIDYNDMFLDVFTDSTGYSNTIDTGATTANYDSVNDLYENNSNGYPSSLKAYWKLSDVEDATVNNHDLGNADGVSFVAGKLGNAGQFATDQMTVGSHADFQFGTGDFTIAMWLKTSSTNVALFSTGWSSSNQISMGIQSSSNYLSVGAYGQAGGINDTTVALNDNVWHRIVVTRVSNELYYYCDGEEVTHSTIGWNLTSGATIYLGSQGGSNKFTGLIDDVRIYKGESWDLTDVETDWNSGTGEEAPNITTDQIVVTETITIPADATDYQVYATNSVSGTGTVTYQISFDDGSNYSTAKNLDTKYTNVVSGTSVKLKFTLARPDGADTAKINNYALMVWS